MLLVKLIRFFSCRCLNSVGMLLLISWRDFLGSRLELMRMWIIVLVR